MILVNNSPSQSKWFVTSAGGQLNGTFNSGQYHRVDSPPGNPPYTVTFTCTGIEGVTSKDAIVTFDTGKTHASYPEAQASSAE
jgi:hypothetical protein